MGLRNQVTVSDVSFVKLRRVPPSGYVSTAKLLSFRYGFDVAPYNLIRAAEAGGEIYRAGHVGVAVTVPSADAVRLIGSTNNQLQNLGGHIALVAPSVPRTAGNPLGDEQGLRFAFRGFDDADRPSALEVERQRQRLAEDVKGHYYGYRSSPEAKQTFEMLAAGIRAEADRFLKLVNGLHMELSGQRLTLFAPDHFPVGRNVPEMIGAIARNHAHDCTDYMLRKRGFDNIGEWGFFTGANVAASVTCRIYSKE
jgi:hypothetical protein